MFKRYLQLMMRVLSREMMLFQKKKNYMQAADLTSVQKGRAKFMQCVICCH